MSVILPRAVDALAVEHPAMSRRSASALDLQVGERIRRRRAVLGLSGQQMAEALGISYQQFHKYEHGTNRVSASRLFAIAGLLGTSISFFYDEVPAGEEPILDEAAVELAQAFNQITDPRLRQRILELVKGCVALAEPAQIR